MKKNLLKGILAAVLAASLVFGLAACGGGSSLTGKWMLVVNGNDAGVTFEFNKDGTGIMGATEFTYKTDKNDLTITLLGQNQFYEYKVSGSTLTLIDSKNKVESQLRKM